MQSLLLGVAFLVVSVLCFAMMVIADLQRTNRTLLEHLLERVKELQYGRPPEIVVGDARFIGLPLALPPGLASDPGLATDPGLAKDPSLAAPYFAAAPRPQPEPTRPETKVPTLVAKR